MDINIKIYHRAKITSMNESMTFDCQITPHNACVWLLAYIQPKSSEAECTHLAVCGSCGYSIEKYCHQVLQFCLYLIFSKIHLSIWKWSSIFKISTLEIEVGICSVMTEAKLLKTIWASTHSHTPHFSSVLLLALVFLWMVPWPLGDYCNNCLQRSQMHNCSCVCCNCFSLSSLHSLWWCYMYSVCLWKQHFSWPGFLQSQLRVLLNDSSFHLQTI